MAEDDSKQQPVRNGFFKTLRKTLHWKCFVLTVLIVCCLAYVLWCRISYNAYTGINITVGPCSQGYNFIPVAFGIMLYVIYVMECWHCRTRIDLGNQVDIEQVYNFVNDLKAAIPIVWWRALSYHYIRRTRQVTRYRNGDAVTSTQVFYERVNSHSAGSVFGFDECGVRDISKKLAGLETAAVTRVRFTKGFVFANLQAANEFEEQRARFFQENEQLDDYMEVREGLDFADLSFKDSMLCFGHPSSRPWFASSVVFWLASFLLLSWPLRFIIEYKTAHVAYQVTKLFGTNYLSPSSQNYTGPLTRTSTIDSRDLEAAVQANYVIVPSYSQALLMDPVSARADVVHDGRGNVHVSTRQRWRQGDSAEALCNETVIPNYGALMLPDGCPLMVSRRSNSMTIIPPRNGGSYPRSISIGSLSNMARGGYRTLPASPLDGAVTSATGATGATGTDDPPPSYEVALRMCAPLYERLRRSASSLQRLSKWSLSRRASSKDAIRDQHNDAAAADADTLL